MQEEASEFAAFVGIDWADRKHDVCLQVPGAATPEASVLEHRPTVIDAWARRLRARFGGRPIAVCVDLAHRAKGSSHNATIRALAFKGIRILFRCWVDRTPYDESRYLSALQRRQWPLLKFVAAPPS